MCVEGGGGRFRRLTKLGEDQESQVNTSPRAKIRVREKQIWDQKSPLAKMCAHSLFNYHHQKYSRSHPFEGFLVFFPFVSNHFLFLIHPSSKWSFHLFASLQFVQHRYYRIIICSWENPTLNQSRKQGFLNKPQAKKINGTTISLPLNADTRPYMCASTESSIISIRARDPMFQM